MFTWPDVPINGIVLGQILSLLVTCTSSVATELALNGASIPFTQGALQYALLFLVFAGPVRLYRWQWDQAAWKYALVAGIDVVSTGCIVKAFSLTSVTSVTLLDNWTIPCVILLTVACFRQRYTITQIISAGVAVSGLAVLLLFDDSNEDSVSGRSSVLVGDALVLAGATGYAINNVLTEYILKTGDAAELLCGMGCFGLAISAVLVPTTESKAISEIEWTWLILILLAVYAVALFMFSLGMPVLLHRSGSTIFNLSLLTSDFYAVAVRGVFFEGFTRKSLGVYLVSCAAVVAGLVVYFTSPPAPDPDSSCTTANPSQYATADLYDAYNVGEDRVALVPELDIRSHPGLNGDGFMSVGEGASTSVAASRNGSVGAAGNDTGNALLSWGFEKSRCSGNRGRAIEAGSPSGACEIECSSSVGGTADSTIGGESPGRETCDL